MAYTKYSLTPANNNAAPPDGAPEGMLPSAVNDTMRDMMAQIRDVGDGIRGGTYTMTAPVITGGSITGVALSGNTFTNPVITGGSINNTPIGATTASTGKFSTLTNAALTSGRVTYAGTSGVLQDDADFTFNGTTVTMANDASISGLTVGKGGGAVSSNAAVGAGALGSNTTGGHNNTFGYFSSALNTTGNYNNAFGWGALYANTTGSNNIAIGEQALQANTTASRNTAVGYQAGYTNTTNIASTYVGYRAGYLATGAQCTFVGDNAGQNSTGTLNGFFGQGAGYLVTSGAKNTIIGSFDGNQGGFDIRTAINNIVLSDGDGNPRARWNNSYWLFESLNGSAPGLVFDGVGLYTTADNVSSLGFNTSFRWSVVYAANGTIQTSDRNLKTNIEDLSEAEKRVAVKLKGLIKKFKYIDAVEKKGDDARTHIGIIAQELEEAFASEGLDATRYGMFCFDDTYTVDGEFRDKDGKFFTKDTPNAVMKRTYAVRYDQLLAFIISII
jgi:hypothetical protein